LAALLGSPTRSAAGLTCGQQVQPNGLCILDEARHTPPEDGGRGCPAWGWGWGCMRTC